VTVGTGNGVRFRFWDPHTWKSVQTDYLSGRDSTVAGFHPTQPIFALAGGPHAEPDPNGKEALSSGLEAIDYSKGQEISLLLGHSDVVRALAFSPDGAFLASGGADRNVCLRKIPLERDADHLILPSEITGLAYMSDGKTLVVATQNDGVSLWDVQSQKQTDKLPNAQAKYVNGKALATSHDGLQIAYLNADNRVAVYDLKTKADISTLRPIGGETFAIAFSPDDKLLATGGESAKVQLWEVATGKELHGFRGHFGPIRSLLFLSDDKKLVTLAEDATLRVWNYAPYTDD
jgi:WD40 repeat protein